MQPPAPRRVEVADVAPGMVPRETDYVTVEPAHTVTTPEPAPRKTEAVSRPASVRAEPPAPQP
ncbi:hypothetical protein ABK046_51595, partial [Streptomyces caeruleatus]